MLRSITLALLLLIALLWTMTASAVAHVDLVASQAIASGGFITVTTTVDELNSDGDCSLREAIQSVAESAVVDACTAGSGENTIYLPAGHYLLAAEQIVLTDTMTLQGSLSDTTILDGNHQSRVLYIEPHAVVTLRNLDIRNGDSGCCDPILAGGGIANYGALWIAYSAIHDNLAGTGVGETGMGNGADGGGVYNKGILTVTNSTISANAAGNGHCSTHIEFLGCGTPGDGGGIKNYGTLLLENSTVTHNQAGVAYSSEDWQSYSGAGGGIDNQGSTTIKNTIIANNQTRDCAGLLKSLGGNLLQITDGCLIVGDYIHWGAHLAPLAENGGPTLTHALGKNSPAIDVGSCADSSDTPVTLDQRGAPRPQGDGCDIGAFESPYTSTFEIRDMNLPLISH